jgi:hypothetical protein
MRELRTSWLAWLVVGGLWAAPAAAELRVGAVSVDVTPLTFPVLINGGMTSGRADGVTNPIHARALVLEDGDERVAVVVVDSCMMSRPFLDEVKALAAERTGIRAERMLISATHAHSVPASMGCLGTDADEKYVPFLRLKLVDAIVAAAANVEPARVGYGVIAAPEYTALRRWIRRPDAVEADPFGNPTVRANMHAGRDWSQVTGESGPEDPDLSLIAFQALDGRPIAVLANFSMHYFSGEKPVGADYFGRFAEGLKQRLQPTAVPGKPAFVGIMSHGCSGDIWRMDYTQQTPERFNSITIDEYATELLDLALQAYEKIEFAADADLAMAEARLHMQYRVPDKQRLQWAQAIVDSMGDRLPRTTEEVYAREQVLLHERQSTDIVVQALRIGSIAIATTPTETYALTGIKLKLQSPLRQTMVIELANGGDGYIPPPEQHGLGGYNTWAARSAGLEVEAEPRIVEAGLEMLEQVAGQPRRTWLQARGPAVEEILASQPAAYYRLDETAGPRAVDSSGSHLDGFYEPGVVFFLEGPQSPRYSPGEVNRAAATAGGRIRARVPDLKDRYSVSLWIWNGMPPDSREIAGWFFARGRDHGYSPRGDALGMIGRGEDAGKLVFQAGDAEPATGKTAIERWTWAHVMLVRDGDMVRVYLNGQTQPEIEVQAAFDLPLDSQDLFFGGRGSRPLSWEGRLDEIVVHRQAISVR